MTKAAGSAAGGGDSYYGTTVSGAEVAAGPSRKTCSAAALRSSAASLISLVFLRASINGDPLPARGWDGAQAVRRNSKIVMRKNFLVITII